MLILFLLIQAQLVLATVNQQDMVDAILGKQSFSQSELASMDLNNDGVLNVADIVFLNPVVSFTSSTSSVNEVDGTVAVAIEFSDAFTGTLHYTLGGSALSGEDYTSLTGSVSVNGNTANLSVTISSDTDYEGDETIELSFLPDASYLLGEIRRHIITVSDNSNETTADYLFNLSRETSGIAGDTTAGQGLPPTIFSRSARIALTFSSTSLLRAQINETHSTGFTDNNTDSSKILAESASFDGSIITLVFRYDTESESMVSDPPLSSFSFDPNNLDPVDFGTGQTPVSIANVLTIVISDFDLSTDLFSDSLLEGTYTQTVNGILNSTEQFFTGKVLAIIQQ